jgi:hypothetical protein
MEILREQALSGERTLILAVSACSNHIEVMHGSVNAHVRNFRSIRMRSFILALSTGLKKLNVAGRLQNEP